MSIEFWEKKKSLIMLRKQPLISNSEMSQFSSSSYPNLLHAEDTLGTIYSLFSLETLSRCLFLSLSLSLCASYIRDVLILYLSDIHFEKKNHFVCLEFGKSCCEFCFCCLLVLSCVFAANCGYIPVVYIYIFSLGRASPASRRRRRRSKAQNPFFL